MLEIQEQIVRLVHDIPNCTYIDLLNCLHPSSSEKFNKYLTDLKAEKYISFHGISFYPTLLFKIDIKGEKFIESRNKEIQAAELQKQLNLKEIEKARKEAFDATTVARNANRIAAISAIATALNFLLDLIQIFQ